MVDNFLKALEMAVAVVILGSVFTYAFYLTGPGQRLGMTTAQSIIQVNSAINDSSVSKYAMDDLSGADVVNCIRENRDALRIFVFRDGTKGAVGFVWEPRLKVSTDSDTFVLKSNDTTEVGVARVLDSLNAWDRYAGKKTQASVKRVWLDTDFKNLVDSESYVNPMDTFTGEVVRSSNGALQSIVFAQKARMDTPVIENPKRPSSSGGTGSSGSTGSTGGTTGTVSGDTSTEEVAPGGEMASIQQSLQDILDIVLELKSSSGGSTGSTPVGDASEVYPEDYSAISEKLLELQADLQGISDSLDSLSETVSGNSVSGLEESINDLNEKIKELDTALNEYSAGTGTAINNAKEELSVKIDAVSSNVTVTKTDLEKRLSDVESKITSLETTVTDMSTVLAAYGTKLDSLSSSGGSASVSSFKVYSAEGGTLTSRIGRLQEYEKSMQEELTRIKEEADTFENATLNSKLAEYEEAFNSIKNTTDVLNKLISVLE